MYNRIPRLYSRSRQSISLLIKLARLIQYFIKFILPFIKTKQQLAKVTTFLDNFGALMSITRRVFRIGRYFASYKNLSGRLAGAKSLSTSLLLKCLADVSGGLYLLVDHFILFDKIKALPLHPETAAKFDLIGNLLWLTETVSTLFYQVIDLGALNREHLVVRNELGKIEDKHSEEYKVAFIKDDKMKIEHFKKSIDIVRLLADIPLLVHFLTSDKVISNELAGLFGVVSSSILVYQKFYK